MMQPITELTRKFIESSDLLKLAKIFQDDEVQGNEFVKTVWGDCPRIKEYRSVVIPSHLVEEQQRDLIERARENLFITFARALENRLLQCENVFDEVKTFEDFPPYDHVICGRSVRTNLRESFIKWRMVNADSDICMILPLSFYIFNPRFSINVDYNSHTDSYEVIARLEMYALIGIKWKYPETLLA